MTTKPAVTADDFAAAFERSGARIEFYRDGLVPDLAVAEILGEGHLDGWQVIGPELVLEAFPDDDYLQWEVEGPHVTLVLVQQRGRRAKVDEVYPVAVMGPSLWELDQTIAALEQVKRFMRALASTARDEEVAR